MATPIKWENANFTWDNNPYTWDEVQLIKKVIHRLFSKCKDTDLVSVANVTANVRLCKICKKIHV